MGDKPGEHCHYVHARTARATMQLIHVNWAYRSEDECKYERYPPGRTLAINEPISSRSGRCEEIPTHLVLRTHCVFNDRKRPAFRCAHFFYGRECHFGNTCDFAHVIHIDPDATPGDRAPVPSRRGESDRRRGAVSRDSPMSPGVDRYSPSAMYAGPPIVSAAGYPHSGHVSPAMGMLPPPGYPGPPPLPPMIPGLYMPGMVVPPWMQQPPGVPIPGVGPAMTPPAMTPPPQSVSPLMPPGFPISAQRGSGSDMGRSLSIEGADAALGGSDDLSESDELRRGSGESIVSASGGAKSSRKGKKWRHDPYA